jgi:hypothetical protein
MELAGICGECRQVYKPKRTKSRRHCSDRCRLRLHRRLKS